MKITTLIENTAISEKYKAEHGLSLYIETHKHKLLFDMGASAMFIENAWKMDVDPAEADLAVISHGHYDHGGGLEAFLEVNDRAKIYVQAKAFEKHYALRQNGEKKDIGLDEKFFKNERLVFVDGQCKIDDGLQLFSVIRSKERRLSANKELYKESGGNLVPDDFEHEQNLLIEEEGNLLLVAGCAHNGIVNIVEYAKSNIAQKAALTHVVGGFHLCSVSAGQSEDPDSVREMAEYLKETGARYYTCHCTGKESYQILKKVMGDQIQYLAAGSQINI
jgi:7,8-dihydropterin-6-yl-methyl-4-(beta-D-ribofuranosyl)aminobenzene 5'-phosphate synthase